MLPDMPGFSQSAGLSQNTECAPAIQSISTELLFAEVISVLLESF
jgi:hypothetical protein